MGNQLPISVIFLTLNEEYHLPKAIDNVKPWVEDIFVVDSLSDDATVDIALDKEVKIVQRPFTNFGDQWNYALENLPIETEWTMKMDPDERITDELRESILEEIKKESASGFSFFRRLWFMGKPLNVKNEVVRIWKTDECTFSDVLVNEHPIINGEVKRIDGYLEHLDSKNLHHWYDKQNYYSTLEAKTKYEGRDLAFEPKLFGSSENRKMFIKKWFSKIPFRFLLLWFYLFFKNGLWKNGYVGRQWASCRVEVMKMRERKFYELKSREKIFKLDKNKTEKEIDHRIKGTDLQQKFLNDQ